MARNQKNFQNFTYVDDNADTWNIRGEDGGAAALVDGHAALTAGAPVWIDSGRRRSRMAVYEDPVTHRQVRARIYTPTAYAALTPGDIVAVQVEGLATTVNYSLVQKVPERNPIAKAARQLADT